VEAVPATERHAFRADLLSAREAGAHAVGAQRTKSKNAIWEIWISFCNSCDVNRYLTDVGNPVVFFQVFGERFRDGRLSPSGKPVKSRSVEDAWRKIGQTMADMGYRDYRNILYTNKLVRPLAQQLKGYARDDDPAERVKPVPLAIARHPGTVARTQKEQAIADMCIIGFFFLCRPGEFVETPNSDSLSRPFRLEDVEFLVQQRGYRGNVIPLAALASARAATLWYNNQKNGVRGQGVTMGASGDPHVCPVRTLARRIRHLRDNNAAADTPIYSFWEDGQRSEVYSVHVTHALRLAAAALLPELGIEPRDISCRSLRPGGATAMLCARIDLNVTRLVGRWRSDEMLKYLHVQTAALMQNYSRQMLEFGHFSYNHTDDVRNSEYFLPSPVARDNTHPLHPDP
jgi:hypothetical protein